MRKAALLPALLLGLLASGCVVQPVGSVAVDTPEANVRIGVRAYPELVLVPGSPVYYAPWVDQNYFFYDGLYWVLEGDNWYASYWFNGPWSYVRVDYVPVFILRVPVYYYRRPPVYFRHWRAGEPPRWDERWGTDWAARHPDWRRHDGVVPAPAPRPDYQRGYGGKRYPSPAQQQQLREQHYSYRPREHVELVPGSRPAATPPTLPPRQDPPSRPEREDRRPERPDMRPDRLPPGARENDRLPRDNGQEERGAPSREAQRTSPEQWLQQRDNDRAVQEQWRQQRDNERALQEQQRRAGSESPRMGPERATRPDADRDEQQRRQAQWEEWQDRQRRQPEAAPQERLPQDRLPQERLPQDRGPQERLPQQGLPQGRPDLAPAPESRPRRELPPVESLPRTLPPPREAVTPPVPRERPVAPAVTMPERAAPTTAAPVREAPARDTRPSRKEVPSRKSGSDEDAAQGGSDDSPRH